MSCLESKINHFQLLFMAISLMMGGLVASDIVRADETANPKAAGRGVEFFERKVRPVLVARCFQCHSASAKEVGGSLLLDSKLNVLKGGESGAVVVPGKPEQSLLVKAIEHRDLEMPPNGRLPDSVIYDIRLWIKMGAPMPDSTIQGTSADALWSFQPIRRPPIPAPGRHSGWPISDIDRFVAASWEKAGLQPVQDAASHELIRRVSFDLIGLPPSVAEIDAFETAVRSQGRDVAMDRLVDRLLASPAFGERWGRHWLDLARFAESNGGDRNVIFPNAWRYRDYVIDAFNRDTRIDDFISQQLAGDLLPTSDSDQRDRNLVATGWLTLGSKLFMETDSERFKMDVVDEQIDVVTRSVLGLTVSCARCHDHKFDPIPTRDYYALANIFENTFLLYGQAAPAGNQYGHDRPLQPIGKDADKLHGPAEKWKKAVADQIAKRNKARSDRYRVVRKKAAQENKLKMAKAKSAPDEKVLAEIETLEAELKTLAPEIAEWDAKINVMDAELKELEDNPPPLPDYAMAVRVADESNTGRVRVQGNHKKLGDAVQPGALSQVLFDGTPSVSSDSQQDQPRFGRLELARWLTDPAHPLTARVAANRIWKHLFGVGLVRTVDNFGTLGESPTHPLLLDYLASRLIDLNWSRKALIREIVVTRTYQLSSRGNAQNQMIDPDARLRWRASRRRLQAEPLRDAILAISGALKVGRPESSAMTTFITPELNDRVRLTPEQLAIPHRTVYLPAARMSLPELPSLFDVADPTLVVGHRTERLMASQQLYFLNNDFILEQSRLAAARLIQDAPDQQLRLRLAFRRIIGRTPTTKEATAIEQYLAAKTGDSPNAAVPEPPENAELKAWTQVCHALFASADFRFLR